MKSWEASVIIIGYRARYWWRKTCNFFGFCHKCWNRMNFTTTGRPICPWCGK
jgi:hypothetical protein